jgi:Flp pilus assembly pilin Flp
MLNNLIAHLTVAFMDIKEREEGQGLVEYSLILAFVSILSIVALGAVSGGINGVFGDVTSAL